MVSEANHPSQESIHSPSAPLERVSSATSSLSSPAAPRGAARWLFTLLNITHKELLWHTVIKMYMGDKGKSHRQRKQERLAAGLASWKSFGPIRRRSWQWNNRAMSDLDLTGWQKRERWWWNLEGGKNMECSHEGIFMNLVAGKMICHHLIL